MFAGGLLSPVDIEPLPEPPQAEYSLTEYTEEEPLNVKLLSENDLKELVAQVAEEYQVSRETMESVIDCESQWVVDAYNPKENSMGLVQIHHSSWPEITDEQRTDPEFSIRFLAEHLKAGEGYLWSCFKE